MNAPRNLIERLLKLYPVDYLKEQFNIVGGNQSTVIETVLAQNTQDALKNFSIHNLNRTKQHIYIFTADNNFTRQHVLSDNLPINKVSQNSTGGIHTVFGYNTVGFESVVLNPFEETILRFYQPIKITARDNHLMIQVTKLEKNIDSYFPENRKVVDVKRIPEEETAISEIVTFLSTGRVIEVCDINRGIKHLWRNNIIDSKYVKWRRSRSTSTEAMDESYTLKNQYPEIFDSLINAPLTKTIFKYLRADENLCRHFSVDPGQGQIGIALYPQNDNQIDNVVNSILSNN
ncbi:MAG: hypothetical protein RLZZ367_831 [Bacteroidota bacterium]|jgi:hypothetical protein